MYWRYSYCRQLGSLLFEARDVVPALIISLTLILSHENIFSSSLVICHYGVSAEHIIMSVSYLKQSSAETRSY